MPTLQVWAGGDVRCKSRVEGARYRDAEEVKFVFRRKDDQTALGEEPAALEKGSLGKKYATATWRPPDPRTDELFYVAEYQLEIDGASVGGFGHEVEVWTRTITVTVRDAEGQRLPDALVRFAGADTPASPRRGGRAKPERPDPRGPLCKADGNGVIVYRLKRPEAITTAVSPPFVQVGDWEQPNGRNRDVVARQGFVVELVNPTIDEALGHARQWVNLDGDPAHLDHGADVTVLLRPVDPAGAVVGDRVYLRAEFDANNAPRTPRSKETAPGGVVELKGSLDDNLEARFTVRMGPAGGDKVAISVGATPDCADDRVEVVAWRRLHYTLAAPETVAADFEACVHPDGSAGFDFPAPVRDAIREFLDPTFTAYVCLGSRCEPDAGFGAHLFLDAAFVEHAGRRRFVLHEDQIKEGQAFGFVEGDARTVRMKLGDVIPDPKGFATTYQFTAIERVTRINVGPRRYFPHRLSSGGSILHEPSTWTARIKEILAADPNAVHPGVRPGGKPKKGDIDPGWVRVESPSSVVLEIPEGHELADLVGPAGSPDRCPITVVLQLLHPNGEALGSAAGNRQLVVVDERHPRSVARTLLHELAHSSGLTVIKGRYQPPYGLDYPPHVDNGGDVYVNSLTAGKVGRGRRIGHQGPHCAEGIDDKTLRSFRGRDGTCIMFGAGSYNDARGAEHFCATCVRYLKARNVDDLTRRFFDDSRRPEQC